MSGEVRSVNGAADRQNADGTWVKYWSETSSLGKIGFHTRGACLWRGLQARTKAGGNFQLKHPTYVGATCEFENFQEFMEWATKATGYFAKDEKGRVYCLDKDLIKPGNKVYGKTYCRFVPNALNMILTDTAAKRGKWPLGVYFHTASRKFRSVCKSRGRDVYLGGFLNPVEAHAAWQDFKAREIILLCREWKNSPYFQQDVAEALLQRAFRIQFQHKEGLETIGDEVFRGRL